MSSFFQNYRQALDDALATIDETALIEAALVISETKGTIWVGGNGGSASIANHLCCDVSKGTYLSRSRPITTQSLSSNIELITALANDWGYETTLEYQLKFAAKPGDALILISSSGRSPNILRALNYAKYLQIPVIGLTGFTGDRLKEDATVSIHVTSDNYGVIEDCHQTVMHMLAQYIDNHLSKS